MKQLYLEFTTLNVKKGCCNYFVTLWTLNNLSQCDSELVSPTCTQYNTSMLLLTIHTPYH